MKSSPPQPSPQVLQHPHGLTIFEDTVFWTERYSSNVMMTNKFHGGNVSTLMEDVYQPMGVVMDHPVKQPAGTVTFINHHWIMV